MIELLAGDFYHLPYPAYVRGSWGDPSRKVVGLQRGFAPLLGVKGRRAPCRGGELDAGEAHEGHGHEACHDEGDAHAAETCGDVGVAYLFAYGGDEGYRQPPSEARPYDVDDVGDEGVAFGDGEEAGS